MRGDAHDVEPRVVVRIRGDEGGWLRLEAPVETLEARRPEDVPLVLAAAERLAVERRCYVAGYLAYEAAAAFGLATLSDAWARPLAWFAAFPAERADRAREAARRPLPAASRDYRIGELRASLNRQEFAAAVGAIKEHLAAGDTYQVNYTFRLDAPFAGNPEALFVDLAGRQHGDFAAYLDLGDWAICCASPELFFERRGDRLRMRPMKGTAPRGRTMAEDAVAADRLRSSEKQRAENVMIVDMVRNDLGRVAEVGSVVVSHLFTAERYPTLWQLTSEIGAVSPRPLGDVVAALHPCASVTGAPKARTMAIIRELEDRPRGVYTGAVGYLDPAGQARFAVGIRTAVVDRRRGMLDYGVGSGIVWDSDADSEYDECLLKARILEPGPEPFELLETLRWSANGGFVLLERHLDRIAASADYFDFRFDRAAARAALTAAVPPSSTGRSTARRFRLLLAPDGSVRIEQREAGPPLLSVRLRLAPAPVDVGNRFLFHKTTRRDVYADALAAAGQGVDDVVLWNADGYVTESTIANVVMATGQGLITPPADAGLLPGTLRAQLLEDGVIREEPVTVEQLCETGWCWLVNSVQGWRRGILTPEGGGE